MLVKVALVVWYGITKMVNIWFGISQHLSHDQADSYHNVDLTLTVVPLQSYYAIYILHVLQPSNILRPRQNGHHFPDSIFKCIFLKESIFISIQISLKFVPTGPINNIPVLIQIMAWCSPGDKPLSEPVMVSLLMYIYMHHSASMS